MPVTVETRAPRGSAEKRSVEAAIEKCLGARGAAWRVTISPSGALAHWWVLDLSRPDGRRRQVFVNASRNVQHEVCRRLAEAVRAPGTCETIEAPCPMPSPDAPPIEGTGRLEIHVDGRLPADLRERFEGPLACAFDGRPGAYRVRVQPGRTQDEVVVLVSASQRRAPLPLFFPGARSLEPRDVFRIVANVLEGMGPGFE